MLSKRFAADHELMIYTLSVGENIQTYEQLRSLRNKQYGPDSENAKDEEMAALKKSLLNYLSLGPERYMQALERLKDLLKAGVSSDSLREKHDKVTIPNMPRMVVILIALDRYTSGLEEIRRLKDSRKEELIGLFRKEFVDTEVMKLKLITREEVGIFIDNDCSLGAKKEDLKKLKSAIEAAIEVANEAAKKTTKKPKKSR